MNLDLQGKQAIVCGSSQGIGCGAAWELAELGAAVTLLARDEVRLAQVRDELPVVSHARHEYLVADFSDPPQVGRTINEYVQRQPTVHILVNNTGGPAPGTVLAADVAQFQQAFANHLVCNQMLVQALVPGMQAASYGRIINIISTSVKEPIPGLGVSNTIRGAVAGWAKTLAGELGPLGITVNNVLPGFTDTARLRSLIANRAAAAGVDVDELTRSWQSGIPARRFADAREVGAAIAFLASPAASYINGINLPVDGGRTGCL